MEVLENLKINELKRNIRRNNASEYLDRKIRHLLHTEKSLKNYLFMHSLPDMDKTQEIILNAINSENEFALVRFGLYEYLLCYQYLEKLCGIRKKYSDFIKYHITLDAGLLYNDENQLDEYATYTINNLNVIDILSYWRNIPPLCVFKKFYNKNVQHINVDTLYPYPFLHKTIPYWQKSLEGKRVLVVSSFAETIREQYKKRIQIWKNESILPNFNLVTYKAIQTNGGQIDSRFATWSEAFLYMKNDILKLKFDIALVSCGAYGMPLAMELKRNGRKVIQWGGCFQLWFGILGGRWDKDPAIFRYVNSEWTYPAAEETPPLAAEVGNFCYWKPVKMSKNEDSCKKHG